MVKKFFGNLALIVVANLLVKPFWILGIDRTVQNTVGTETYGNYAILFNFSFILSILLDMGINNYNSKIIARHPQLISKKLSAILVMKFILALVYITTTLLLGVLWQFNSYEMYLLALLCINQILAYYITYLRTNLSAMHFFRTDTLLSVTDKLLVIGFCGTLLWSSWRMHFTIEYFIYAQTLAYVLTAMLAFALLNPHVKKLTLSFSLPLLLSIFKRSYPYALLSFLMVAYTRIDTTLLRLLLPESNFEAGIYASAYRILDAVNMLAVLVAGLLLPIFLRALKEKQSLLPLVRFSYALMILPAMLMAVYACMYQREIMQLLNTHIAPQSAPVFALLMLTFLPIGTVYIYGTLLTANESLAFLNRIAAIGLLLNILLNLYFIPRFGSAGAAFCSLVTQSFIAGAHMLQSYRLNLLPRDSGYLLRLLLCGLLTAVAGWWVNDNMLHTRYEILIPAVVMMLSIGLLRIFDIKQGIAILKRLTAR
jgi:O-antigen/teichoic acid export membrane protein